MLFNNYYKIFSVKILSVMSLVFLQFFLAKQMSIEEYGVYSFIMSLNIVLASFSIWGLDKHTIKSVSLDMAEGKGVQFNYIINVMLIVLINCSLSIPIIYISLYYGLHDSFSYILVFNSLFLLLTTASAIIASSVAKGTGNIILSEFYINLLRPLTVIILAIICVSFFDILESRLVIYFMIISYMLITIALLFKHKGIIRTFDSIGKCEIHESLYKKGFPYLIMGVGLPYLSNIDILFVGLYMGSEDVAVYSIASKMVGLILIGLVSANMLIMPKLAVMYKNNQIRDMQNKVKANNLFIAIITMPCVIAIVFFGGYFLEFINPVYINATEVIEILLVGQIVNVLSGPVNIVCAMAGQQVVAAKVIFLTCVIQTFLCYISIPSYGIRGAAVANVVSTILLNIFLLKIIIERLNFNPSFASLFKK